MPSIHTRELAQKTPLKDEHRTKAKQSNWISEHLILEALMITKLFVSIISAALLMTTAQAQTWFFLIPSQKKNAETENPDVKPESLLRIIADLAQKPGYKALTYALIDTGKGKQWVWGYEENALDQQSANSKAMSICIERMKFAREQNPKPAGLFVNEGRTICDFHNFQKD